MRYLTVFMVFLLCGASQVSAGIIYDANVTTNVIFGSGNANGFFTVDQNNGVELGLRAKLRHNAVGNPENTFNSNGAGTYTFQSGVAPTQTSPTAVWSFEWSINSNFDGTSGFNLNDLTYQLSMTSTTGSFFTAFDPINLAFADHAIGSNATGSGAGVKATNISEYASLIAINNLAQNSWKPHWIDVVGFNPSENGLYNFTLTAFSGSTEVASTMMTVAAVPEPASLLILSSVIGLACLPVRRRRRRRK